MSMRLRSKRFAIGLIAATVFLGVCAAGAGSAFGHAGRSTAVPIKVGVYQSTDYAPIFVAIAKGYFKDAGLNVKVTFLPQDMQTIGDDLTTGSLKFATMDPLSFLVARDETSPIQYVTNIADGPTSSTDSRFAVMVPSTSKDKTLADLATATVTAVDQESSASELYLKWAVDRQGSSSSKVQETTMPYSQMIASLQAGKVDAIDVSQPYISQAVAAGFHSIGDPVLDFAPGLSIGAIAGDSDWMNKHASLVTAFKNALNKAVKWSQANKAAVRAMLPTYYGTDFAPAATLTDPMQTILPAWDTNINISFMGEVAGAAAYYHLLYNAPDFSTMIWSPPRT